MSSQTMLIILIAVAFLIVLLALLVDEPSTEEDDPVADEVVTNDLFAANPVVADVIPVDASQVDAELVDALHDPSDDVEAVVGPAWGQPAAHAAATNETMTDPMSRWQPRDPDQGDTDDARRAAGLPPTPDH